MTKLISTTEKETYKIAKDIASNLKGGEVIGLIGDLGAGKTTFTKGLAKALKVKENVTSPTFVIMNVYNVSLPKSNIKKLCHIDAYRIKTENDILAIGAEEFFNRDDTVTVVEWADQIKKILPIETIIIDIKINNNKRTFITKL